MVLSIITRDGWHAEHTRPTEQYTSYIVKRNVFLMNLYCETCISRETCSEILFTHQLFNINTQKLRDIRFNFMIGGDGNVYEGRGLTSAPMLPKQFNSLTPSSFIIAFLGAFTFQTLPEEMYLTANKLVEYCIANSYISNDFLLYDLLETRRSKMSSYTIK